MPVVDSFHSVISFEIWQVIVVLILMILLGSVFSSAVFLLTRRKKDSRQNAVKSDKPTTKHFFSCIITLEDKSVVHGTYAVDVKGEYPSTEEVKQVQNSVLKHVPNAKFCTISSISRLRD